MTQPSTLVNLTGRPVFVLTDGVLLRLPEAPPPRVVELQTREPGAPLTVLVGDTEAHLTETVMHGGLVSAPPEVDRVLWLVAPETLTQFPHRADFIRPATYRVVEIGTIDCSAVDPDVLAGATFTGDSLMVLVTVSRSAHAASADAVRLQDLEAEEA